ncbi:MAG: ferredoxin family protein [Deltaproteobacteria bacterium]|nr:ferredoxin family protein [Deltaproteobacteria bacterium]
MSYVITQKCLGEVYARCVSVCPADCILPGKYQGQAFMVIDPDECIDCSACLPECPIGAIVASEEEDPEWAEVNLDLAPQFKKNPKVKPRDAHDPPRRKDNKLVSP